MQRCWGQANRDYRVMHRTLCSARIVILTLKLKSHSEIYSDLTEHYLNLIELGNITHWFLTPIENSIKSLSVNRKTYLTVSSATFPKTHWSNHSIFRL
jgi:hypothetical protein